MILHKYKTKFGEIHYLDSGGEGGKLLVFLHGFLGKPLLFEEIARIFTPKGYRVIAPYLPGHGKSFALPKEFSFQELVLSIEEMISALKPKEVCLMGHSLGGAVAWQLGQRNNLPISKIVVVDPGLGKLEGKGLRNSNYLNDLKLDYPDDWHWRSVTSVFHKGFKFWQILHPKRMVYMVRSSKVDFANFSKKIKVLVLWGRGDLITPFESYRKELETIKNLKISFHEGGHHWFYVRKEEYLKELEAFLNSR